MSAKTCLALGLVALMAVCGTARAAAPVDYAYGADIGWVTQEESLGHAFNNADGVKTDPYVLLNAHGINAIRLRVWVDPKDGWNGVADTLVKARRARDQGQKIMIDFHYSDNWADPAKQVKPAAWASHTVEQLKADVYAHTHDVLAALSADGIDVAWVQVGNEITNGLLWPEGGTDHFADLAGLTNAGYDAVKDVYPSAAVVIHIDNGWDGAKARWWFDNFAAAGGKVDIIGLSYYPAYAPTKDWTVENPKLGATMTDLVTRYAKPVMVVEVGYQYDQPAQAKAMLADVIARNQRLGDKGLGVFYWEPDTIVSWTHYQLGAMNDANQFTEAMDAFKH